MLHKLTYLQKLIKHRPRHKPLIVVVAATDRGALLVEVHDHLLPRPRHLQGPPEEPLFRGRKERPPQL